MALRKPSPIKPWKIYGCISVTPDTDLQQLNVLTQREGQPGGAETDALGNLPEQVQWRADARQQRNQAVAVGSGEGTFRRSR